MAERVMPHRAWMTDGLFVVDIYIISDIYEKIMHIKAAKTAGISPGRLSLFRDTISRSSYLYHMHASEPVASAYGEIFFVRRKGYRRQKVSGGRAVEAAGGVVCEDGELL